MASALPTGADAAKVLADAKEKGLPFAALPDTVAAQVPVLQGACCDWHEPSACCALCYDEWAAAALGPLALVLTTPRSLSACRAYHCIRLAAACLCT